MVPWLPASPEQPVFPPTRQALGDDSAAPGLLAAGGCLNPRWLTAAYRRGIFPWYGPGEPLLWWSTAPRMVLRCDDFRLHRSLRKTLQRVLADPRWALTVDQAFDEVIHQCARQPRDGQTGSWIVPEMIAAYTDWHRSGGAHSFEVWHDGALVGGLYGVAIGRMFYGESMFARETDASKIALAALVAACRARGVAWIDCQQQTRHLASFGAAPVEREAFEAHLASVVDAVAPPEWTYDRSRWTLLDARLTAADPP